MDVYENIDKLGLVLPDPPKIGGVYLPAKQVGNLLYLSGVGPVIDGKPIFTGKIGNNLTLEQGREAAQVVVLNMLSIIQNKLGDLNEVTGVIKILGWVASASNFNRQPEVINAASQLLVDIFGMDGQHSRSAIGVNVLPGNIPVEIEGIFQVR